MTRLARSPPERTRPEDRRPSSTSYGTCSSTLLPTNSDQVERVLEAVLAIPPDTGYRFVGGLAALATAEQACIMVKDETDRKSVV